MKVRTVVLLALAVALVAACGDRHISLYALNRSGEAFVLQVGDGATDTCYLVDRGAFGRFYEAVGDIGEGSTERLRLYRADGTFWTNLGPRTNTDIFVLNTDGTLDVVAAHFEGPPASLPQILNVPELPEVDGRSVPGFFPTTEQVC